ncbi:helix-turn-helix domain-containing protein [Lactobacillus helveticus]|uniref:helix-turn-helix domain-containing protein n=1 Tax=Lactobacillus helveticus TaxID=1587 RepID=UPI00069A2262|nr:helix-turn-helix transcriptional regulator [Lactobacillus helveticus]
MNRIKELREKRSLSQRQFVTDFNKYISTNEEQYKNKRGVKKITFGTASRWENSLNKPTEYMWQALADFFNVSVAYLKGAYSKKEIAQITQETYKKNYYQQSNDILIRVFSSICDDYFVSIGAVPINIKKEWRLIPPEKVESLEFWKNILEELYIPYVAIRWLIEKPSLDASKKDVIDAVKGAMSAYSYSSSRYNERCIFIAKHTFYRKQVKKDQAPEYLDFNREHPLDNQIYY